MKVFLLGAFDRNNYGDLLFPIIVKKAITNRLSIDPDFFYISMKKSDLSNIGAYKTQPLSYLKYKEDLNIIVAGGEVLGTNFLGMHLCHIDSDFKIFLYKVFNKIGFKKLIDLLLRLKYNSSFEHPWLLSSKYNSKNRVIFNTVGGTNIDLKNRKLKKTITSSLKKSKFISVRDFGTAENLRELDITDVEIAPDSALIMSSYFPKKELINKVSNEFDLSIFKKQSKYFVFQVSEKVGLNKVDKIAAEINLIVEKYNITPILLPIGRAKEHNDQIVLKLISNKINYNHIFPEKNTIFDTMAYIAFSEIYIGTSLHGAITAISYGNKFAPFTNKITKLLNFLDTWKISDYHIINENNLFEEFELITKQIIDIKKVEDLKIRVEQNFDKIVTHLK